MRLREFSPNYNWAIAHCLLKRPQCLLNPMGSLKEDDRSGYRSEPVEPFDSGL